MPKWRRATYADHDAFCRIEGWRVVRNARGKTGSHHITYEFDLPDGRILRTRILHPADRTDYGPQLWWHILRDQLDITEELFWVCIQQKTRPVRTNSAAVPEESIDASIIFLLISRAGLSESDVRKMSKEQAIAALNDFWIKSS